ncbi:MAG TPA: zinc-binding dehydrogenase [Candidatus Binataceae bacterium]|nr:zinc-binding dehydrogenase [Candidatus Binataceae bacterium]
MESIRAVVVDPRAPQRFVIDKVAAPTPAPSEALVKVAAISLNLGELRRSMTAEPGSRIGWDFAGTVERAAADGSGPRMGARVVGMLPIGAWAEMVAAPTVAIAQLPDSVSFAQASTLPVAGLTALYSLELNGSILERKVLITGASGGVGHLACQLARHAGAQVIAVVRRREREKHAREAGAHQVVVSEDSSPAGKFGPYHLVLESVGGASLTAAISMLAPEGMCVLYGASGTSETTFDARAFYLKGGAAIYGFILFHELRRQPASEGLRRLLRLMAEGVLKSQIEIEAPWTEIANVAERFYNRGIAGKAVLLF